MNSPHGTPPVRALPCSSRNKQRQRCGAAARGFTIIELVIVMVIIAVLSALVFPSFVDAIRKGRRTEAFGRLNAVQMAQERWRSNNANYSAQLSNGPTDSPPGLGIISAANGGRYTLAINGTPTATAYVVVASAVSGSSQVEDGNCAQLAVSVNNGNILYGSAAAGGTLDFSAGNRCWAR
ncbi:MAG: type IV pilin protein [Rubrivivax sp.]